jgi:haloalkane dehalogenase
VRDIPLEADHPSRRTLEDVAKGLSSLAAHEKLILWGGRDFCFDETFLARWREIYPDARLRLLERVGHYVLEDGGPEARTLVADFLNPKTKT